MKDRIGVRWPLPNEEHQQTDDKHQVSTVTKLEDIAAAQRTTLGNAYQDNPNSKFLNSIIYL